LTGVTHLASAGVAVLTRARRHAAGSAALRLIAPPGTPADQILTLVQIPRDADEETNPVADE
jgi:ABC-type transporter Mla MlaB component